MMSNVDFSAGIDVIVRFHDINRLKELNRAIFSIVSQHYRPINIILCVQRFSEAQIDSVLSSLKPMLSIEDSPSLVIENFIEAAPIDARSALVNIGFRSAKNRFITFLDYDDIIYSEAYQLLSSNLRRTGASISFASINVKRITKFPSFDFVKEAETPFLGSNLLDLFEGNFCPIHSFMIDRQIINKEFLIFDALLTKGEDYDFLLRIVSQFKSDFSLIGTFIGSYSYKDDGSNTIIVEHGSNNAIQAAWKNSEEFLEGRRRITQISSEVQAQLGISPPKPGLTVRGLLDASGRLVPRAPEPISVRGANVARQIWREFVPHETRAKIARIRAKLR
jgi:hypothetical protein